MIEFEHVNKTYDKATDRETKAVRDISLKIDRGEFVFIVGNSGSGKTTLIRLLLKEIEASSGLIRVGDTELTSMKRKMIPRYRRRLGVVFQDFRLLKDRNVYENVAFAQRVVVTPTREIKKRVPEVLSMVGLSSKYKSLPSQLSGGEQQRVALARALVNNPQLIIADEPTGNIDPELSFEIVDLLNEINKYGVTIIMVTHEHELVSRFNRRVITLEGGHVTADDLEWRPAEV